MLLWHIALCCVVFKSSSHQHLWLLCLSFWWTIKFAHSSLLLFLQRAYVAPLRYRCAEAADDARSTTNKASLSVSLCAVPAALRCSGAGILMNTWRQSGTDRQAPGCGAVVMAAIGWWGACRDKGQEWLHNFLIKAALSKFWRRHLPESVWVTGLST